MIPMSMVLAVLLAAALALALYARRQALVLRSVNALLRKEIEERARIEQELRTTDARFQLALESAGVATYDWNLADEAMYWDAYFGPLIGLPGGEAGSTERFFQQLLPADRASVRRFLAEGVSQDGDYYFEFRVGLPEGRLRHIGTRGTVQREESGAATRLTGAAWDITEAKEAALELRASEERLHAILNHSQTVIYLKDLSGRYLLVNDKFRSLLGFSDLQILGRTDLDLWPPELAAAFQENDRNVAVRAESVEFEEWALQGDRPRLYLSVKFPVRDDSGEVYAVGGISTDITERKQAELALAASEQRLRMLIEASPHGVLLVGADSRIQLVNQECEAMFGYSREALVGMPLEVLIPEARRSAHGAHVAAYFQRPKPRPMGSAQDLHARRQDGVVFPVEISLAPIPTEAGVAVLASINDITARKGAEETLLRNSAELRRLNEELRQSNEELNQFAYIASHDLQEPLRTVITYSGFLREDLGPAMDDEVREDLVLIEAAARRMRTLVQDLLEFSRSGRRALERGRVPLSDAVRDAMLNLEHAVAESRAQVHVDALPEVHADRALLAQVFQNLIGNAVKFQAEDAVPEVWIAAERAGGMVRVSVRDNGIGIPDGYLGQLFTPFRRLHSEREYDGTGIGLAICRKIVERHGGVITVASALGQGTTFTFTMPAAGGGDGNGQHNARSADHPAG
jgi:PAS domain S-box-containing protein